MSGGSHVLVDQTAEDRFSADLTRAEVWCGDAGTGLGAGDALVDVAVCWADVPCLSSRVSTAGYAGRPYMT